MILGGLSYTAIIIFLYNSNVHFVSTCAKMLKMLTFYTNKHYSNAQILHTLYVLHKYYALFVILRVFRICLFIT